MKAIGFDGRERPWTLFKHEGKNRPHSHLHITIRKLLKKLFPRHKILEEIALPGSFTSTRKSTLYTDFFIPSDRLVIEAHGKQHYEFVSFYYKTKLDFQKAKARDRDKIAWCQLNDIDIVILKYSETENEWTNRILNR